MNPSRLFIERPVATTLLMIAILMIGVAAYKFLPLSALPEVDYPTIQVQTFYPGASPEVMTSSVTAPLERQFGQMPSLSQMMSQSSAGASVITLRFSLDLSLDIAEQEVQAAINAAGNLLPADLPAPPIYAKVNPADAPILTLGVTSKTLKLTDVEDIVESRLVPKLSQLPGVGLVSISGGQRPAVRIHANPLALAAYGLNLDDLRTTISNLNVNTPKGNFDGPSQSFAINANDQIRNPSDYLSSVVAYRNDAPILLSDVATVEHGGGEQPALRLDERDAGADRQHSAPAGRQRHSSRRQHQEAAADADGVAAARDHDHAADRPHHDDPRFGRATSNSNCRWRSALVVLVIFLFLRNIPATIIPSLSVPLSLVGALAIMYQLGFSLDNLSLMALTIATGFVVDDAIVMIENIARYLEEGDSPVEAALKGSQQIGFTIISLTISLIAVLIPLLFMGDVVGRLFHEFAITLAATIVISAVVSLTLVPMLCAKLLKPTPAGRRAHGDHATGGRFFQWLLRLYASLLNVVLNHQVVTLLVALATFVLTGYLYVDDPQGILSGPGHRRHPGRHPGRRRTSPSTRWPTSAGPGQGDLGRPRRRKPVVVHRRRRLQRHAQFRPHPHQSQAARANASRPPATIIRRLQQETAGVAGISLYHAAGAGPVDRHRRQRHPIPVHPGKSGSSRRCRPGRRRFWRAWPKWPKSSTSRATCSPTAGR